jgi:hypothetical protein
VRRATQLAEEQGLTNVSFKVMDALAQTFETDTFDLVWACESGEHMPNKVRRPSPTGQTGSAQVSIVVPMRSARSLQKRSDTCGGGKWYMFTRPDGALSKQAEGNVSTLSERDAHRTMPTTLQEYSTYQQLHSPHSPPQSARRTGFHLSTALLGGSGAGGGGGWDMLASATIRRRTSTRWCGC